MGPGVIGFIGLLFGSVIAWLVLRSRTADLRARLALMEKQLAAKRPIWRGFSRPIRT